MSKFREGCPLALSHGVLVNYTKDVDANGKAFVTLFFLVDQLLQSVGYYISANDILERHKDTLPDDKPYNIKIKIPSESIELAKSLTLGETYWIEYATGIQSLGIDNKLVSYQGYYLVSCSATLPEHWKTLIRATTSATKVANSQQTTAA